MPERVKRILPVFILAATGLVVSIAIENVHRRLAADVNYVSFCNVNAQVNCDVVLGSRYASLAGVSVAAWAILYYLVVLAFAAGVVGVTSAKTRETFGKLILVLSIWGLLFSMYLAVIALAVLRTVCLMCSALYLVSIGLFLASWWLQAAVRTAGRRGVAVRAGRDRLIVVGSVAATVALIVVGSWEAFGRGVRSLDPEVIAHDQPEFLRWIQSLPVAQMPSEVLDGPRARGNADAAVTIVEFSDFECGHCATFHESLEEVLPRLGQMVRVVFHHFPLDSTCNPTINGHIHPGACLAAVAAECAGEQGKFWQYHNLLFDNQQQLDRQFLIAYASRLGLDVPRFTACLGSPEARARVERDARAGGQLKIDSTPTIFINGRTIKGALDVERLTSAVALASANGKTP